MTVRDYSPENLEYSPQFSCRNHLVAASMVDRNDYRAAVEPFQGRARQSEPFNRGRAAYSFDPLLSGSISGMLLWFWSRNGVVDASASRNVATITSCLVSWGEVIMEVI